jgi:hypothetical protein
MDSSKVYILQLILATHQSARFKITPKVVSNKTKAFNLTHYDGIKGVILPTLYEQLLC